MTKEQKFFLQVLSDHISQRPTEYVQDMNWEVIARYAHSHQVGSVVFYQCRKYMEFYSEFEKNFSAAAYYYVNRVKSLAEIKTAFDKQKIAFFTVKGLNVARYYPVPVLRTMGDIDIIVHEEDKERTEKVLVDMGFVCKYEFLGKEQGYSYQGMQYELHHHLVYDEAITILEQKKFFNSCWEYVKQGELDHSFHFLFLIVHLRKHLLHEGAGFRQFMDIAVVGKTDIELDWPWIEKQLKKLKLEKFSKTCFALIYYWFGISFPIQYPSLEELFLERATNKIFENGVFGFNDAKNSSNNMINEIRRFKGHRRLGRIVIIIKRAFPNYEYLCTGKQYAFLKKRPYLLPVAWGYRFYMMIKGRTTNGKDIVKQIMTNDEKINLREDDLRRWGLID